MRKKIRAIAIAGVVALGLAIGAAPAQAHYDPWNTHWHYSNGQATYKMCGWWDKTFGGCQDENRWGIIVLR